MSNLIVSLLAIALVSIITVIGVNYLGSTYYQSQADGQAAEIVAQASKVANAMQAWSNANGSSTFSDTNWSDGNPTDLTTNHFLDALPQLGSYAIGIDGGTDYYFKAMPIANVSLGNEGVKFDSLVASITSINVCNSIARLARGDSALPLARTGNSSPGMGDFSYSPISNPSNGYPIKTIINGVPTAASVGEFDCIFDDDNGNSTLDSGESMFFIYKVF